MLHLVQTHWLWFFGALALGVILGWLVYPFAAPRSAVRPRDVALVVVTIGIVLAVAEVVPRRYGARLEIGAILAFFAVAGGGIGWALRDLAEFMPAARPGATPAAAGSYLFRDAFAGLGAGSAYMRAAPGGGIVRQRLPLATAALTQAPAAGGYTFPATLPFADATTSRRAEAASGPRRHWSWPQPAGAPEPAATAPAFTGSKGGYVFPTATTASAAPASRQATTRTGQLRHWSWRGAGADPTDEAAARGAIGGVPTIEARSAEAGDPPATASAAAVGATATENDGRQTIGTAPALAPTGTASAPAPATAPIPIVVERVDPARIAPAAIAGPASTEIGPDKMIQPTPAPVEGSAATADAAVLPSDPIAAGLPAAPPSAPGQPATIAAVPGEEKHAGTRPEGLMAARDDRPHDLKRIRGIGPRNEGRLHGLGIWHFDQIAAWTPDNVRWVGSYLAFPGRIDRETWVEQAKVLAGGGDTAFSQRMLAGKVASSIDDGSHGQANIDTGTTPRTRRPPR